MATRNKTDVEVIVDEGDKVVLESGTELTLLPLKSRQFFKLLKIVTHGAGGMLLNVKFSPDDSPEEFGGKLMALIGFAIPDAEDEVVDFILAMVRPAKEKSGMDLTKSQVAENKKLADDLFQELYNPELGDLLTILEAIVKRESADLQALGKRLMQMFDLAKKTGQVPATLTE